MQQTKKCAVIVVTHNSASYLHQCLECLKNQTVYPHQIIIVDSGSHDSDYLNSVSHLTNVQIYFANENIGFCKGNNIGFSLIQTSTEYVLFLNPDAFLTPRFIEQALLYMEDKQSCRVGALSGLLCGFDMTKLTPTGKIDSAGIFKTWYGRWYDRNQGKNHVPSLHFESESVPALCGALLFCRKKALEDVMILPHQILDPDFFMYKEDIDLSLRLKRKGWDLIIRPQLIAYHCRGWNKDRSKVPKDLRLLSAKNEMRLYRRDRSPCLIYSSLKYLLVKLFNV